MTYAAIAGSAMIIFIAVLRLLFLRRLPKRCFKLLWILVALRLILPFSLTYEVELPREVYEAGEVVNTQAVIIDASEAIPVKNSAGRGPSLSDLAHIILPLGTIISGGFFALAYLKMRKIAKSGRLVSTDERGTQIRTGGGADSPFSCGVIRPIIFVPSHMLELDAAQLDIIISHEKEHIKRLDQLVKWLVAAALCVNWYNPLAWVMWYLSSRDIELACDEAVVRSGKNNADYALTLIGAAELRSMGAVCSFGAPLLNERIECIMKSKKLTVCGFISAAVILAAASVFFVQVTAAQENDVPDAATDALLEQNDLALNISYESGESEGGDISAVETEYDAEAEEETEFVPILVELSSPLSEHGAITGRFGEHTNPVGVTSFNNGINVAAAEGTPVYAAAAGTVVAAEYSYDSGNYVVIEREGGSEIYRHLSEIFVTVGDEVALGDEIGTVGSTGCATGPNLGFSIIRDGAYISPEGLFE